MMKTFPILCSSPNGKPPRGSMFIGAWLLALAAFVPVSAGAQTYIFEDRLVSNGNPLGGAHNNIIIGFDPVGGIYTDIGVDMVGINAINVEAYFATQSHLMSGQVTSFSLTDNSQLKQSGGQLGLASLLATTSFEQTGGASARVIAYEGNEVLITAGTALGVELRKSGQARQTGGTAGFFIDGTSQVTISGGSGTVEARGRSNSIITANTGGYLRMYNDSTATVSGGRFLSPTEVEDFSQASISGGVFDMNTQVSHSARLAVSGGTFASRIEGIGSSRINLSNGTFNSVEASNMSEVVISGGTFSNSLSMTQTARLNMTGGIVQGNVLLENREATIGGNTQIQGTLGAVANFTPEILNLTINGNVSVGNLNVDRNTVTDVTNGTFQSVRAGSNAILNMTGSTITGGFLGFGTASSQMNSVGIAGDLTLVGDSQTTLDGASNIHFGYTLENARLTVNGSTQVDLLSGRDTSWITVNGGTFTNLDVQDSARLTINGGNISFLAVVENATAQIYGGNIGEIFTRNASSVQIYGGIIGANTIYGLSPNSLVSFFGTGIGYGGSPVAGTYDGLSGYYWDLFGTLENGDALQTRYFETSGNALAPQGLQFFNAPAVVPESGSILLAMLGLATLPLVTVIRRRANPTVA